ncbi:hypothetical protein Y1Q_0017389 [Alligator mississippiensis]|uniref:Uncharacterized protein n=1 Tax=Alligator mississippiensis TaxID=8496 RepID=A0A151P4L6_ALLMI|nr:hypothetical protein Y1Q_0017389 [Alligator mississippiensis]
MVERVEWVASSQTRSRRWQRSVTSTSQDQLLASWAGWTGEEDSDGLVPCRPARLCSDYLLRGLISNSRTWSIGH